MDDKQRLDLSRLLKEYKTEETTDKIRELKHSSRIHSDVATIQMLKHKYSRLKHTNKEQFKTMCRNQAKFLYDNYTNIFNRVVADELDLEILSKFLSILEQIENGEIDQHDGSYMVGSILKELYIDSALKQDKKRTSKEKKTKQQPKKTKNISWNEFKTINSKE